MIFKIDNSMYNISVIIQNYVVCIKSNNYYLEKETIKLFIKYFRNNIIYVNFKRKIIYMDNNTIKNDIDFFKIISNLLFENFKNRNFNINGIFKKKELTH